MDLASLIGFLGTLGMIAGAMISAGGLGMYIDVPSILIVFGGSFFAVMYTAPLPVYLVTKQCLDPSLIVTAISYSNKFLEQIAK